MAANRGKQEENMKIDTLWAFDSNCVTVMVIDICWRLCNVLVLFGNSFDAPLKKHLQ